MNDKNDTQAVWPTSGAAWYMVLMMTLAYILSFIDRVVIGLLVGPIRADLGIGDTQISLLYGFTFAFFYTAVGIPIAWLIDRYHRRNIIVVGVALWSAMTAFCGVVRGFWELASARIGVAVGEAVLSPAAYSMAGDSFPSAKLGRALSVYLIGLPAGVGLALIIGGKVVGWALTAGEYTLPLVGAVRPWQLTFIAVGLPGLLLALLLLTVREPKRRQTFTADRLPMSAVFVYILARWRPYAALMLGFSVLGMVMNVFQIWGLQYFVRQLKLTLPQAGQTVGLVFLTCGTLGVLLGGWLTDRWRSQGRQDAPLRAGLTAAIGLIPFASFCTLAGDLSTSTWMLLPIGLFTAFAFGAGAAAVVMLTPPPMRAQASAIYLWFVNMIGIGLAPFLTALLTEKVFGDDLAVGKSCAIVAGGAAVLAALIFWWGMPHFRAEAAKGAG
jgi:MFS family permease